MEMFAFGMKMDEHLNLELMKFGGKMEPVTILGGRDMTATEDSSTVEKTKGTGGMTTCNKAQANRPEEARLRLPDPGHNLAPCLAFSSLSLLLACLPSSCLSDCSYSFLGFFLVKTIYFAFANELDPPRFDQ